MNVYEIDVAKIEELQTLKDIHELEKIFQKAQSAIVNGEKTLLVRKQNSRSEKFDEITTLEELNIYKRSVFKYLMENGK